MTDSIMPLLQHPQQWGFDVGIYKGDYPLNVMLKFDSEEVVCFTCGETLDPQDELIYWSGCGAPTEPVLLPSGVLPMHPGKDIVLHPQCALALSIKLIADAQRVLPKVRVVA